MALVTTFKCFLKSVSINCVVRVGSTTFKSELVLGCLFRSVVKKPSRNSDSTPASHRAQLPFHKKVGPIQPHQPVSSTGMHVPNASVAADNSGIVVWRGPLCFKSRTLCEVELVASTTPDFRLFQL